MSLSSHPVAVTIPLLNPNEPDGILAAVHITEGSRVARGAVLCTIETTKSTADVEAETAGYVVGLRYSAGQTVRAGEVLCYLSPERDWTPPPAESAGLGIPSGQAVPDGLRITQPALALARQSGLDFSRLPADTLVTEAMVRKLLGASSGGERFGVPEAPFDATALVLYGGGGHGKSLIDLIRSMHGFRIVGVVDDGLAAGGSLMGIPILGGSEALPGLYADGVRLAVNAVGGIGSIQTRVSVFQKLAAAGFGCPAVFHPKATIEPGASLSAGVQVFAQAYIGSEARVGYGCIVNTGAVLSHDCILDAYANISPGAILAGEVSVGAGALIGMGATINLRVRIGAGARIGNGATVKENVPENGVVRAGSIWPN